jgi:hypothetical protein
MQARRVTALVLSCALGLLLLTATHATAHPKHAVRTVALLAPTGVEIPHSWRSAPDDLASPGAQRTSTAVVRAAPAPSVALRTQSETRAAHVRGPPGPALA